jgi:hypothetical protein
MSLFFVLSPPPATPPAFLFPPARPRGVCGLFQCEGKEINLATITRLVVKTEFQKFTQRNKSQRFYFCKQLVKRTLFGSETCTMVSRMCDCVMKS